MSTENIQERPIPSTALDGPSHPPCGTCNRPATGYCRRCHNMWYCSDGCLPADRTAHQPLCEMFSIMLERPIKDDRAFVRAICFPILLTKPYFFWLELSNEDNASKLSSTQLSNMLHGSYEAFLKFDCHRELRRDLGYQIEIVCGASFALNPSLGCNKSLRELLPRESADYWKGAVIARGVKTVDSTQMPVDIDTAALPPLVSFLGWWGRHAEELPQKVYALDTVMGDGFDPPIQT